MTTGLTKWFHTNKINLFVIGLIIIIISSYQWWRDVTRERTFQGLHTIKVTTGIRWGIVLFIISEILFFFSFFWAFFHSRLAPTFQIGLYWPPTSITPFNPFQVPILNTAILLASGVRITWAHHAISQSRQINLIYGLTTTIILGVYFTSLQALEYFQAPFNISDSIYGSTFFVATGFHGLHVLIGTSFILVILIRSLKGHFSSNHHIGLEASIWYWHFVDVVWLFLFISIYWWGSCITNTIYLIIIFSFITISLSTIIINTALFLGKKFQKSRENNSSFECGFSPIKKARTPFSLRFFLITIIFLIFDAEIALILPLGLISLLPSNNLVNITSTIVILLIIAGLFYEWKDGILLWK